LNGFASGAGIVARGVFVSCLRGAGTVEMVKRVVVVVGAGLREGKTGVVCLVVSS